MNVLLNKIRCTRCGDEIESVSCYDFKFCSCGAVAVDGGHHYLRRVVLRSSYTEMSLIEENGEIKHVPDPRKAPPE